MANILKIVFLGLVGFSLLVFLTVDKPKQISKDDSAKILNYDVLPSKYELVGINKEVSKDNLFKKNEKTLIVVGNHDSLSIVKELPKYFKLEIPYVMVANISAAPWFVKKMFIPGKLEELNEGTKIPMIYDFDGDMVNALNIVDNGKTKFTAYILSKEGIVSKVYEGSVKEGALDGSMNETEKKAILKPLIDLVK